MEGEEDEEEEVAHTQMVAKRSATKADAKREQGKVQFFFEFDFEQLYHLNSLFISFILIWIELSIAKA